jgi:hypothetical protein
LLEIEGVGALASLAREGSRRFQEGARKGKGRTRSLPHHLVEIEGVGALIYLAREGPRRRFQEGAWKGKG